MNQQQPKEVLFNYAQGFWIIVYNIEAERALCWINGDLEGAYSRMKELYRLTVGHFKDKKVASKIESDFEDIERLLFNPVNKKQGTYPTFKKLHNYREADKLMHNTYILLKEHIIKSNLELFYGVSQETKDSARRDKNVSRIFGNTNGK